MKKLLFLTLFFPALVAADNIYYRNYGQATVLVFSLRDATAAEQILASPTLAAADCTVKKDRGTGTQCAGTLQNEGNGLASYAPTASEMQCALCTFTLDDATATEEWADKLLIVETTTTTRGERNSAQHYDASLKAN